MGSPSRNVQYHPPRLSEDRLNLPQPHSPSLPTHCTAPGNRECARRCRTASSRWRCRELNPCPVAVFTRPRSPTTPPRRRGPAPGRRSTRRGRPRRRARPGASVAAPTPRRLADHPVPLTRPSPAGAAESEQRHCPGVERPALVEDDRPPLRRGNGPGWSPDGQSVSKKTEGAPGLDTSRPVCFWRPSTSRSTRLALLRVC